MGFRLLVGCLFALVPVPILSTGSLFLQAQQAELTGVKVKFVDYQGPATCSVRMAEQRSLRIDVDPQSERRALTLAVELPGNAQTTWAADVEVVDAAGQAVPVRHIGIEWHKFSMTVPAQRGAYVVRVVDPPGGLPPVFPDQDRQVTEPTTGLSAEVLKWCGGRKAALSIRFDDSHPSHVSKVIPILREYGFRGTFMVCPGGREPNSRRRSEFEDHFAEWEAVARRGDQELANHSAHHRGAVGDEDMEREIGEASRAIWGLFPGKSRLLALNLGGGTAWETTKTLRYYLHTYHLFDASSGSLGMDDVYGDRPSAFRQHLEQHLEVGGWCRIHFHAIGQGLNTSEANFRAAMESAKKHASNLWIAGMADIYKYQTARQAARLGIEAETAHRALLKLSCFTDPQLYDRNLTIDIALPPAWSQGQVKIKQTGIHEVSVDTLAIPNAKTIRFHVLPITSTYVVERRP